MSFYKIRPRAGTATQWRTANTILAEREIGYEIPDEGAGKGPVRMKMGDGVTAWNNLPYAQEALSIVNNSATADASKVASAAVAKNLQDQITPMKVDYVVSQQVTPQDGWRWRKWNSGMVEMWLDKMTTGLNSGWSSVDSSTMFKHEAIFNYPFPLTVFYSVNLTCDWSGYITTKAHDQTHDNLKTLWIQLQQPANTGREGLDEDHWVHAYVTGKWK